MLVRRYRPLVSLNPFSEEDLLTLREEFNRLWQHPSEPQPAGTYSIPLELTETQDAYNLRALLPGVDPSQIDLEATPEEITISVELKPPSPHQSGEKSADPNSERSEQTPTPSVLLEEFRYGKFIRRVTFGQAILHEQIHANAKNGVLSLTIPKAEAARKACVKINVE